MTRRPVLPFFLLAALLLAATPARAVTGPAAELWERWTAHDESSTRHVDHGAWDAFVAKYVRPGPDGINRIPYGDIAQADRGALVRYIGRLAATPVDRLARAEQRAFWINLYNALTVQVVLDHYPVESIRDIRLGGSLFSFFAGGPWEAELIEVEGVALSLNDIEHRILRPIWRDPRIHYAVNCAALGCPDLLAEAWDPDRLEAQLDAAARAYVNHPRGARFTGDGLVVSRIYEWYMADFGGTEAGVLAHLREYAEGDLAARLAATDDIAGYEYDWALNDAGG